MSFSITSYGAERYATTLPTAVSAQGVGSLLPLRALQGIRELADPRGEGTSALAYQVFARKRAFDLVARSRAGDLQATAVGASSASDHVVTVHQTAKAAANLSAGFAQNDTVRDGSLAFAIDGRDYTVAIAHGASLADVADAIRSSGADVDASVAIEDGQQRLSLVRRSTGYVGSLGADSALSVSESYSGGDGRTLDLVRVQAAQNARVTVDQQTIERRSNTISDAVPGTTLRLDENTGKSQVLEGRDAATLSRTGSVSAFTVRVRQLAEAAEARSTEFKSAYDEVQAGKVLIKVDGGEYWIPVSEGSSLVQTAASVNASGAPVQARLERSDSGVSLAITSKHTGFEPGTSASDALQVSFESTGSAGQALSFAVVRQAQNAKVSLNGQAIESRSNELAGAAGIPRLSLKEATSAPQTQGAKVAYNADAAKPSERPNAAAHLARLLQEQVLALATQPVDAGVVAAQAKKLYAPVEDKPAAPQAKITAKTKPQDKAAEANASRAGSPADADAATNGLTAATAEKPVEPVAPAKADNAQPQHGALATVLEQLKKPPSAETKKPAPYAPPKQENSFAGIAKDEFHVNHRRALSRKAKQAYAEHAA